MYVRSIKLKNYMSFEKLHLSLQPTLHLITGENLDIGGKNGVGKSALIESIIFSIYGKNIRVGSRDVKELITNGKRELRTEISLGDFLIKRVRTKTKSSVQVFVQNGTELKDETKRTNTETDAYINYILLPFDKFMYVNYFNPHSLVFFALTPKQKFEVIETLLNLEVVNSMLEKYKEQQKLIDEQLQYYTTEKVKCQTTIELLEKQLNSLQQNIAELQNKLQNQQQYEKEFEEKVKQKFMFNVEQVKRSINSYENQLAEFKKELKELEEKLKVYKNSTDVTVDITQINTQLTQVKSQLNTLQQLKLMIEENKQKGICPTCKRPYTLDVNKFISEQTNNKLHSYTELEQQIQYLEQKYAELTKVQTSLIEYMRIEQQYESIREQLKHTEHLYKEYLESVKLNTPEIYDFVVNFDNSGLYRFIKEQKKEFKKQLSTDTFQETLKQFKQQLESTEQQLNEQYTKLKKIKQQIVKNEKLKSKITVLINELSHSGEFRQMIISNYLKELEESLNVMISHLNPKMKLNLIIEQSGRNKGINVVIFDNGSEKSYGQLSTGERRMVDMSLLLTFSSFNSGFLLIDEALDSLSYENQLKVVSLLRKLNKQILLVTHNQQLIDEEFKGSKKIYITKENGISRVELV